MLDCLREDFMGPPKDALGAGTMIDPSPNPRHRTIFGELEKARNEFVTAREICIAAQMARDAAKEKFIAMRRLAHEAVSGAEMWEWEENHKDVKYVGMDIGDAIERVLEMHAWQSALDHIDDPGRFRYSPAMADDALVEELEAGGFEFKSSSPLREIHAAVINKKSVTKLTGGYRTAKAKDLLEQAREMTTLHGEEPPATADDDQAQ